ncbi:MAG: hypothetical protein ACJAYF_003262 [Arenicella sp.]|jgi:hypothetical protein
MPALFGEAYPQAIGVCVRSLALSSGLGHIKKPAVIYALWVQRDAQ